MDATHLLKIGAELGEGPVWIDGALWFVDIKGRHIYRHRLDTAETDRWDAPEMVGWVLPSAKGDLIAGLQSGPHRFSPETGAFDRIASVDTHLPANRLNDAAIDARGRIFFGTMDNDEASASGRVYILDGGAVHETPVTPTEITNGPAIAPCGKRLYHVDTLARTIVAHAIAEDGSLGSAEPFLAFTGDEGHPDGAICDAEGGVWVGFYGGWAARRFSRAGELTEEVRFPVANVTKVALGGADGRTAFATTARQGLDAAALAAQPLAGDVFTFRVTVPAAPAVRANS
ncbi:Sugar lactone lactonase YvrE [Sphingomonas sp. OV641]|uniref:SMP-30/gluconolactonase/LRE family protein n=1 Tax=Sphingomonas sp. OV641 TaxID=1881068 RepID=UPI0008B6C9F4|nr:SMP-30/gluconolactonase/LRE family protein [Sphingomonas sp. OV641]SEI72086.1 Sugar lactone lactonase YvrE [Sphingomonas sp. OV641]